MKTNRVAQVNAALKAQGFKEKLTRGRGYYCFRDGDASTWHATSVYIYRADDLTVDQWMEEYHELRCV
jgi:hypothetical protein